MLFGISAVGTVKRSSRGDERQGGLCSRTRPRRRSPDFAPSSKTPDFASSFRLREATSASREATSGRLSSTGVAARFASSCWAAASEEPPDSSALREHSVTPIDHHSRGWIRARGRGRLRVRFFFGRRWPKKTAQHQPPSLRLVLASQLHRHNAGRAHSLTLGEGLGDGSTLGSSGNCLGESGDCRCGPKPSLKYGVIKNN
jgi:hypothetical protein